MDNKTVIQIFDYINSLYEGVIQNTAVIKAHSNFLQLVAKTVVDTQEMVETIKDLSIHTFTEIVDQLTVLQDGQLVLAETITHLANSVLYTMGLGLFNLMVLTFLTIWIIRLHKKVKELE